MPEKQITFAERVELLMEQWNCLIDELKNAARLAGPDRADKYDEAVNELIAYREAAKRGLFQLNDLEKVTHASEIATKEGEEDTEVEQQRITDRLLCFLQLT